MRQDQDTLIHGLRSAGMRITPQRRAICNYLSLSSEHPTASMIFESLQPDYPNMSLATVYNTLEALVTVSSINVVGTAGDHTHHYDADISPHIHLACIKCHSVSDFAPAELDAISDEITASGFSILGARISVYGICADCQSKDPVQ